MTALRETGPVGDAPDVSVVVISYNDAGRLPRAIRSVQRQTLRALEIVVVDDASTDETSDIVRALAAEDPRIRYVRLEQNSGGCSAPRNRGLDVVRAPWVMFCDSDDEYERHACKNLLEAAEALRADVVCGTAERVDTRTGRARRWRPEVHERVQAADGLADLPDLLYDTISVNKIYRAALLAEHGIRFPEGLLFEDQLFTLEAMAAAARVAAIPQVVYRWYVDRLSDEPSITQRRNEARNVESRIEVNRRIDAFLAARGDRRLAEVKARKFLTHDLYLYLASMLEVDDATATLLMDRLAPYVEQADLRPAWQARPGLRVAIYHLLQRDLTGIREAMRFVKWASVVDVRIVRHDGRDLWGCSHLPDGPSAGGIEAAEWLDMTAVGILSVPFTQRRYLHRVDALEIRDGRLTATGSTVDYDGSLAGVEGVELRYLIGGDRTALSVPARWTGQEGLRRTWRAEGAVVEHLGRPLDERDRGTLGIALCHGSQVNVTSARSPEAAVPPARLAFPGRSRWTGPDTVDVVAHDNGAIGWRSVRTAAWRNRLVAARAAWFRLPGTTRLATAVALVRRDWLPPLVTRAGLLLPRRRLVVLEADGGRDFGGAVRWLGEALARGEQPMANAWVYRSEPARVPAGAAGVKRQSLRHCWLLARASVRIDDGTAAPGAPSRCLVVNAAAEVPVHRLGLDDPSVLVSAAQVAAVRARGRRWDLMVSPSPPAAAVLASALAFRGTSVDAGLLRMDRAVRALTDVGRAGLRPTLDLPEDRAIVLHVPARRRDPGDEPLIDVEEWAQALGRRAYLVIRQAGIALPTRLRGSVRQLAPDEDVAAFVAASDLVVSDYEPLIGDAALVDRPVVLFQPDRQTYVNRTHGLYPGVDDAGPVVLTSGDLVAEVARWLEDRAAWDERHGPARRAWADRWCGPDDGRSTERAVAAVRAAVRQR